MTLNRSAKIMMYGLLLAMSSVHWCIGQASDTSMLSRSITRYDFNRDDNIYSLIQGMMRAKDPSFNFMYAGTKQGSTPTPDFRLADGELRQSILELRLAQRFSFAQGEDTKSKHFGMLHKMAVNFDFQYRIGKKEKDANGLKPDDSPGHPLNTKFGVTLFEHAFILRKDELWKQFTKERRYHAPPVFNADTDITGGLFSKKNLKILVPRLDIMHYSNGQDTGAFYYGPGGQIRNDYKKGNFSTNYLQLMLSYIRLANTRQFLEFTVAGRSDFGIDKWLSYERKQRGRYGFYRANTHIQYRTGPFHVFSFGLRDGNYMQLQKDIDKEVEAIKASGAGAGKTDEEIRKMAKENVVKRSKQGVHKIRQLYELAVTFDSEHILDKTRKLPDLTRTSFEFNVELRPLYSRYVGYMFSIFHGRDYLNIRYDLPVTIIRAGFTFQLNRYRPALSARDFRL